MIEIQKVVRVFCVATMLVAAGCGGDGLSDNGSGGSNETGCVVVKQLSVGYSFRNTCSYKIRLGVRDTQGGTDTFALSDGETKNRPYPHVERLAYGACKGSARPKINSEGTQFRCV